MQSLPPLPAPAGSEHLAVTQIQTFPPRSATLFQILDDGDPLPRCACNEWFPRAGDHQHRLERAGQSCAGCGEPVTPPLPVVARQEPRPQHHTPQSQPHPSKTSVIFVPSEKICSNMFHLAQKPPGHTLNSDFNSAASMVAWLFKPRNAGILHEHCFESWLFHFQSSFPLMCLGKL